MSSLYALDHPLGSACLKLERAHVHLTDLLSQINDALFPDTVSEKGESEVDPFRDGMPDVWSSLIGDFVSNLRHSLDHIAWALASKERIRRGEMKIPDDEARSISFPLHFSSDGYPPRWMDRLWQPSHIAIEGFQPYHRTERPELEMLGILNELSIQDKHRLITTAAEAKTIDLGGGDEITVIFDHQKTPTSVTGVQVFRAGGGDNDDLEPEATSDIVVYSYRYRYGHTVSVTKEFPLVYDLIRDEVIPAFAGFFE